jgi:ribonuclease D
LHHRHTNRPYTHTPISMEKVVDMQIVAAYYAAQGTRLTKSTMPGLKSTCARYLAVSANDSDCNVTYALEKKEQCSDWSQRPLSLSQLQYAGLDAGVLLVLLNSMPSDLVPV